MIHFTTSTKKDGDMNDFFNIIKFSKKNFISVRSIVSPKVQHGANIEHIKLQSDIDKDHICDGLISDRPDVVLGVGNADCFSLFFIDEKAQRFGVAHCGWKGILAELPQKMIVEMGKDGSMLQNIKVVIGPGIRSCHFEVQNDVWDRFYNKDLPGLKKHIDLTTFIKIDLAKAGINFNQIEDLQKCTFCEDQYHSHRRDKVEPIKKQISIIGLRA